MNPPTTHRSRVVAAVIWRNGRVLLGQRAEHKRHGGMWEFPGGQVEPGETHVEAAQRELDEELSVKAMVVGEVMFRHIDPLSGFLIEFVPVSIAGAPVAQEHEEIRWFEPDQLAKQNLAPSDRAFLESGALGLLGASAKQEEGNIG